MPRQAPSTNKTTRKALMLGLYSAGLAWLGAPIAVQAQMPVPILSEHHEEAPAEEGEPRIKASTPMTPGSKTWAAAAPLLRQGLECRKLINPKHPALEALLPTKDGTNQWTLIPPQAFKVLGFPVQSIVLQIPRPTERQYDQFPSYVTTVSAPRSTVWPAVKNYVARMKKTNDLIHLKEEVENDMAALKLDVTDGEKPGTAKISCDYQPDCCGE
jgi:hypothetical protein